MKNTEFFFFYISLINFAIFSQHAKQLFDISPVLFSVWILYLKKLETDSRVVMAYCTRIRRMVWGFLTFFEKQLKGIFKKIGAVSIVSWSQDQAVHTGQPGGPDHRQPWDGPHPVLPTVQESNIPLQVEQNIPLQVDTSSTNYSTRIKHTSTGRHIQYYLQYKNQTYLYR